MARQYSLERRLLVGTAVWLLAVSGVLLVLLKSYADGAAGRAFDRLLQAAALTIADAVQPMDGRLSVDLPYASHAILAVAPRSRIFYRVTAPDGSLITGYEDLAANLPAAQSATPHFADSRMLDTDVRVVQLGRFMSAPDIKGWVTVVSGESREDRDAFAREILFNSFLPTLVTVLAAGASIWLVIRRALKPLVDIEQRIAARQPTDFSPIAFDAPSEVTQLVTALNRLLGRFAGLLSRMQDFLGTAAHQIRTPLASLQAQVEVALDESDLEAVRERMQRVKRNAQAVKHLANQILADTMIAHRGESVPFGPVSVEALCRKLHETAWNQGIDLDFKSSDRPEADWISGDEVMLSEALTNLIDNARKYGGGHQPIHLEVAGGGGMVEIRVTDHGPGIPEQDQAQLLQRFQRGANAATVAGSGLGLAIVSDVVKRHEGSLRLAGAAEGGLTAIVLLARIPPPRPVAAS